MISSLFALLTLVLYSGGVFANSLPATANGALGHRNDTGTQLNFLPERANHLLLTGKHWVIDGVDPYLESENIDHAANQASVIAFDLIRYGQPVKFQEFQIFLSTDRHSFRETNSILVKSTDSKSSPGVQYFTLRLPLENGITVHPDTQAIRQIRLDFVDTDQSNTSNLSPVKWKIMSASIIPRGSIKLDNARFLILRPFAIGKHKMLMGFLSKLINDPVFLIFYLLLLTTTLWFFFIRIGR